MINEAFNLYNNTCVECSQLVTRRYSTSFSIGIRLFDKEYRAPICAIYGFVRFADEIVDTFHQYDKAQLLATFKANTYSAIAEKISLNPILHAFQQVVHLYNIPLEYIDAFFSSMEMDLHFNTYEDSKYKAYIYGSAEVIGLMCLKVFCYNQKEHFEDLELAARALGSAFQKVNFLRDMKSDYEERGRTYFPNIDFSKFSEEEKAAIELDIQKDFELAYEGIKHLPKSCRLGVYVAYKYYLNLLNKIQHTASTQLVTQRLRIGNSNKLYILLKSYLRSSFNIL